MNDRLTSFLYLLMRDHVPTGTVAKLVSDVSDAHVGGVSYSNQYLRLMASTYADQIEGSGETIEMDAVHRAGADDQTRELPAVRRDS